MNEEKTSGNTSDLVNFLISEFVIQTEDAMRKKNPKHTYGHVLKLTFIADEHERIAQRLTWTNYKGTTFLTKKEKEEMEKVFQINIHNEMTGNNEKKKACKQISCSIDVKANKIKVEYQYKDGEIVKFEF